MGRLHVRITMLDDDGRERIDVTLDEPTRLDVDRDPLYVFGRLHTITERAVEHVHDQALQLESVSDRSRGRAA